MQTQVIPNPPLASESAQAPLETLRLLLVEDSPFDAMVIERIISRAGYIVETTRVENEPDMRAALAARHWDAVISDHNLPDFSSTAALRVHKEWGVDAPFIIVSGQIGEDLAVESMLAGADDYVLKSNLSRLPPALRRSLAAADSRRTRREAEQALQTSESRLRGMAANLPGMVFQLARSDSLGTSRFLYASEGSRALLGVTHIQLLEDASNFFSLVHPEDRGGLEATLVDSVRHNSSVRWDGRILPGHRLGMAPEAPVWVAFAGKPRQLSPDETLWEGVLIDITARKSAEEELARSRANLRQLGLHLEKVSEEERKSISREIHDDIGGLLTAIKLELSACRQQPGVMPDLDDRLRAVIEYVDSARQASDRIMRNLRPSVLDQGIVAALEWLALQFNRTYRIDCRFHANQEVVVMHEDHRAAMFRICQEALTNVAKHAGAKQVQMELFASGDTVTLEISDDGKGVSPAAIEGSDRFGLRGMRERADSLGGWVEIHGTPAHGTTIMVSLPLTPEGDA